ncbi:MAG: fibronectin type III-like domain-contianing protein [Pseudomonadota bacterium]|nr:fibronectin type III-like domain-contianing protein [Pseudomonadota bacterium]
MDGFQKRGRGFLRLASLPLSIDREALAYWDDRAHAWVAEAGEFEALVGSSSQDVRVQARFRLTETVRFGGPPSKLRVLGIHSTIHDLMADEATWTVVEQHLPEVTDNAQGGGMIAGLALVQVERPPEETLRAIARDLQALYGAAAQANQEKVG